jgi:Zn-dependent protease
VLLTEFVIVLTNTETTPIMNFAFIQLEWINLGWGLVNLLPVLPLDGGRICEAACEHSRPHDGRRTAMKVSAVVGGLAAAFFLTRRDEYGLFPALLFGMLCIENIQNLQSTRYSSW